MKQISLWLTPLAVDQSQSSLREIISSAAASHGGPRFEPHVTLHTSTVADADIPHVLSKVKQISSSFGSESLPLAFKGLKQGQTRHQSVLVEVEKSNSLLQLKSATAVALGGQQASEFYPHLSVWYGEDSEKRKAAYESLVCKMKWDDYMYTPTGIDGTSPHSHALDLNVVSCLFMAQLYAPMELRRSGPR